MSKINKIINYFFSHTTDESLKFRVWTRLKEEGFSQEADDAYRQVWNHLKKKPQEGDDPEASYRHVASSLGLTSPRKKTAGSTLKRWRMVAVWVVPLLLLGTSAWYFSKATDEKERVASIYFMQKSVPQGERDSVFLPDGSTVWLNANSTLIYPSDFITRERSVYLNGEAFFRVKHNDSQPFIVNVDRMKLRVLGTTFNVSSYPGEEEVSVTLKTGRLGVDIDGKSYLLNPDNRLTYTPATGKVVIDKVSADFHAAWRQGGIFFDDIPFTQVVSKLERIYNVRIHLLTSRYDKQRIRVHFNDNERLGNVLHVLSTLLPDLETDISGQDVYIR